MTDGVGIATQLPRSQKPGHPALPPPPRGASDPGAGPWPALSPQCSSPTRTLPVVLGRPTHTARPPAWPCSPASSRGLWFLSDALVKVSFCNGLRLLIKLAERTLGWGGSPVLFVCWRSAGRWRGNTRWAAYGGGWGPCCPQDGFPGSISWEAGEGPRPRRPSAELGLGTGAVRQTRGGRPLGLRVPHGPMQRTSAVCPALGVRGHWVTASSGTQRADGSVCRPGWGPAPSLGARPLCGHCLGSEGSLARGWEGAPGSGSEV